LDHVVYPDQLDQLEEEAEPEFVVLLDLPDHLESLEHQEVEECQELTALLVPRDSQEIVVQRGQLVQRESKEMVDHQVNLVCKVFVDHLEDKDLKDAKDPLELEENLEQMAKLEKSDLKVYKAFLVLLDPLETRVW